MKNHPLTSLLVLLLPVLFLAGPYAVAQQTDQDRIQIISERMKQRYEALLKAKDDGFIGETWAGLVAIVPANRGNIPANQRDQIQRLVRDESSDRTELFQLMAREAGTTPAAVAERFRIRQYGLAKPGHWQTDAEGRWSQKK